MIKFIHCEKNKRHPDARLFPRYFYIAFKYCYRSLYRVCVTSFEHHQPANHSSKFLESRCWILLESSERHFLDTIDRYFINLKLSVQNGKLMYLTAAQYYIYSALESYSWSTFGTFVAYRLCGKCTVIKTNIYHNFKICTNCNCNYRCYRAHLMHRILKSSQYT